MFILFSTLTLLAKNCQITSNLLSKDLIPGSIVFKAGQQIIYIIIYFLI